MSTVEPSLQVAVADGEYRDDDYLKNLDGSPEQY
jgi:hypothetical protein